MIESRQGLKEISAYSLPLLTAKNKLNANESPWELPGEIKDEIKNRISEINFARYPDPSYSVLKKSVSEWLNINVENILLGSGSNEVIQCSFLSYGGIGRRAMSICPTYAMAPKISAITNTEISYINTDDDFNLDIEKAYSMLKKQKPHIFYIANPNNPTGKYINVIELKKLFELNEVLFLIDEAYGEFCKGSTIDFLPDFPNLAVVKTFSKAYRMAGLRLGMIISNEDVIKEMNKVKLPYNVNPVTQAAAEVVINKRNLLVNDIELIKSERKKIYDFLKNDINARVIESNANFLLFKTVYDADELFNMLYENDVLVRNFNNYQGLNGYMRVTVGTPAENVAFCEAIKKAKCKLEGEKN